MSTKSVVFSVTLLLLLSFRGTSAFGYQEPREDSGSNGFAQLEALKAKTVDELIQNLKEDPGWLTVIHRLRMLNDKRAIGPLKHAFNQVETKREKQVIAATLVSLRATETTYFDYLAEPARRAAQSDMPFPLVVDKSGKVVPKKLSPKFVAWCEERQLEPNPTSHVAVYELPNDLLVLSFSRDVRAADIYLRALESQNFFIVNQGITGLALLGENSSVPAIVKALERMPIDMRQQPAAALMLLDVPEAREQARRFVPDEQLLLGWAQAFRRRIPPNPSPQH